MGTINLRELQDIDGYMASALVELDTGMLMAGDGKAVDLDVASAGNAEVLKSKMKVAEALKLDDHVEDMLITLGKQYHLIRPLETNQQVFLYLVLDKNKSNLAMSRHVLKSFEKTLDFS